MKLNQRGVIMLETLLVFPVVLVAILAAWQLAEIAVADLAVGWASRIAARSAAVHTEDAEAVAARAALQALAPYLPPLPAEPAAAPAAQWLARAVAYQPVPQAAGLHTEASVAGGVVAVRVAFTYRLRIPLVAPLFGGTRMLSRSSTFPVMYAPEE